MFCYVFRPACSDHFTDTRHTFEELLQGLNSWSIGPLTRNKLQDTEYVDNDVDVEDVDDDEEGAGAYFFFVRHSDVHKSASSRSFFFSPLATNSHAQSMSPASCRSKRIDDHSRFYANFRDFRGARVSTLTPHVLKPNADPVVVT